MEMTLLSIEPAKLASELNAPTTRPTPRAVAVYLVLCLMTHVLMYHLVDKDLSRKPANHKPLIFLPLGVNDCIAVFDNLDFIKILCDSLNEEHLNIKSTTEISNNK